MRETASARTRLEGLLLVDKPCGWTSHDVVSHVRSRFGLGKVGHAGTLDPLATGLLVLGVGRATRSLGGISAGEKEYIAGLLLGRRTSTGDAEGEVLEEGEVRVSGDAVAGAIRSFKGEIEQIPPMYSAIKYRGIPLYKYARRGEDVPRKARRVSVSEIEVLEVDLPAALFRAVVSSGTYIRTLCEDIGKKIGCPSTMSYLRRTRVGKFSIANAVTVDELKRMDREELKKLLIKINESIYKHRRTRGD